MRQNNRCAWSNARRILDKTTGGLAILYPGNVIQKREVPHF